MARSIQVAVSADMADAVLPLLSEIDGVLGVARQHNTSLNPTGDIITVQTTNNAARVVIQKLSELGVQNQGSILTSELKGIVSPAHQKNIEDESNETVWEEMAVLLRQDTNIDSNYLALMFFAGAIAAVGLWVDKIHIVVGAMVIAPAFEPLLRIPFGVISGPRRIASGGAISAVVGYCMILAGGAIGFLVLQAIDVGAIAGNDLSARSWINYWSSFSTPGVVASVLGAAAGAFVVSGLRSVLTTGVMITLSLVPSITIVGMAIANGNTALAADAFARWAVDAAVVMLMGAIVIGLKQKLTHRRRSLG
ncbi:hypothetical protein GCM10027343_26970 [Noviherbaspirillum agri]